MITISSVEAQNRFGQLLDTVQREPVTITRHGRVVALMVRPEDFEAHIQNTLHQQESKSYQECKQLQTSGVQEKSVLSRSFFKIEKQIGKRNWPKKNLQKISGAKRRDILCIRYLCIVDFAL